MSKETAVQWLAQAIYDKMKMKGDGTVFQGLLNEAKAMEAEQQNQLAIEFAEWVLTNEHIDTIWSTPKKELFQMFLKTKAQ